LPPPSDPHRCSWKSNPWPRQSHRAFSGAVQNPKTGKTLQNDLIPDAVFVLEYHHDDKSSFRFFVVEGDCATEPSRVSKFNRKSHLLNFLQYREYVGRGLDREHLKLTAGLLVLNVTTSEANMANMLKLTAEVSQDGNSY
jgi:hypothetical protein